LARDLAKGLVDRLLKLPELDADFFARSTLNVAQDLLGKVLIAAEYKKALVAGRIVETEAYRSDDPASHSFKGRTPRASIMFEDPGVAYVYFIYGMYEMLNFVTEPKGQAGAVLIRGIEPLVGEEVMRRRRKKLGKNPRTRHDLTSGPGKLCRSFGIDMKHNGLLLRKPTLWVVDDGFKAGRIRVSPRVGISQGKDKFWRYYIEENSFVSRSPLNKQSVLLRS
jgi:DNA-3-methyladenine glycosylase